MPRINQIRFANIHLDKGSKVIVDSTFDVQGNNAVFVLENGGGKTSIVQLALQVVLPNVQVRHRPLANTVQKGKTGHVAIEWILDGESPKYLCTGICFKNDGEIDYYNYFFTYNDRAEFTIKDLPFVTERQPIRYQELKDRLKAETRAHVAVIDDKRTFQNEIRAFWLVEEEWRQILDVNGREGGVDKFFEKTKRQRQLIENLLIPAVEQSMFNEKERSELSRTFKEHQRILANLPKIKTNIEYLQQIVSDSDVILGKVRALNETEQAYHSAFSECVSLIRTFGVLEAQHQTAITEGRQRLKQLRDTKQSLEGYVQSHHVFLLNRQLRALEAELAQAHIHLNATEQQRNHAELVHRRTQALYSYASWEDVDTKIQALQKRLEIMGQDEPLLTQQLKTARSKMRNVWKAVAIQREETYQALLEAVRKIEQSIADEQTNQRRLNKEYTELQNNLARVNLRLDDHEQLQNKMSRYFSDYPLAIHEPEIARETMDSHIRNLQTDELNQSQMIVELEANTEQTNRDLHNAELQINDATHRINTVDEKLNIYEKRRQQVLGELATIEKYPTDLHLSKDDLLNAADHAILKYERQVEEIGSALRNLHEQLKMFERGYFLPHEDLRNIQHKLEEHGIFTSLGSEWLQSQPLTESQKERVLSANPLLPYSILIESSQLQHAKSILKRAVDWITQIPILLMVKSEQLAHGVEQADLISLLPDLWVFQPNSGKVFVSVEEMDRLKTECQKEIDVHTVRLAQAKQSYGHCVSVRGDLRAFYGEYPIETVDSLKQQKAGLIAESDELNSLISNTETRLRGLVITKQEQLNELEKLRQELENRQNDLKLIDEYLVSFRKKSDWLAEKTDFENRSEMVEQELQRVDDRQSHLREGLRNKQQQSDDAKRSIAEHKKEWDDYRLNEVESDLHAGENYLRSKSNVDVLTDQLQSKHNDRRHVESELTSLNETAKMWNEQISDTGIDITWIIENRSIVTKDDKEKTKHALELQNQLLDKAKQALSSAEQKVAVHQKECNIRRDQIIDTFGEVFPYSDAEHKHQLNRFKDEVVDAAKSITNSEIGIARDEKALREIQNALARVDKNEFEPHLSEAVVLPEGQWSTILREPTQRVKGALNEVNRLQRTVDESKQQVRVSFIDFIGKWEQKSDAEIRLFIRTFKEIANTDKMYSVDFMNERFRHVNEVVERINDDYRAQLEECEKNQAVLVGLCLVRAESVFDGVLEIPKGSRIRLYGRDIHTISIRWASWKEREDEARVLLERYLQSVVQGVQAMREKGDDEKRINLHIEQRLQVQNLIDTLSPIDYCKVRVFKPRRESMVTHNDADIYDDWENVSAWSDGEQYGVYMIVFMVLIAHIRNVSAGQQNTWKAIIADNPFGKASSPHIWYPVIEVAKSNRVQLFCLTALKEEGILQHFQVVYGNKYYQSPFSSKEVLRSEVLQSAFYME